MNATFAPKWSALPEAQRDLWPQLAGARILGYVLYGGTAIALRLGHRVSVDFDFFTERMLDQPQLRRALPFLATATTLQESPDSLTVATAPSHDDTGVKLSFFGSIGFGRVGTPQCTEDGVLEVASLDDLMATKLKVILQRVEAKDYRDIAAMLRAGVDLARGLAAAGQLFGKAFQPSESLKALTWFEGGDLGSLDTGDRNLLIQTARSVRDLPRCEIVASTLGAPR